MHGQLSLGIPRKNLVVVSVHGQKVLVNPAGVSVHEHYVLSLSLSFLCLDLTEFDLVAMDNNGLGFVSG